MGGVILAKKKTDSRVLKKKKELLEIFAGVDESKLKIAQPLIESAAFMAVSLKDLEKKIAEVGWTETYQNGNRQSGSKQTATAVSYLSVQKQLNQTTQKLLDLVPPAKKSDAIDQLAARFLDG